MERTLNLPTAFFLKAVGVAVGMAATATTGLVILVLIMARQGQAG